MRRQPFDLVRASFWLVAGIMAIYAFDLMIGLLFCGYINATHGTGTCSGEKLGELLATLLATAVAFAGGLMRDGPKPYDRPPDEPRPGPIDEDKKPGGGDGEN